MPPIATPETEGRVFGTDWTIANIAALLRSNALRGVWREPRSSGGSLTAINRNYLRTVSARHLPTHVSLIFMRLENLAWYASLRFDEPTTWNPDVAERWLTTLFGPNRPRLLESETGPAHQFTLP
jgi:hypothetical protein